MFSSEQTKKGIKQTEQNHYSLRIDSPLPVNDVLVLAFTALFPLPIGEMQVVVDEGITEETVLQYCVKERLGREESMLVETLQTGDERIFGEGDVLAKLLRQRHPVRP